MVVDRQSRCHKAVAGRRVLGYEIVMSFRSLLLGTVFAASTASAQSILLFDEFSVNQTSRDALGSLGLSYTVGNLNTFNGLLDGSSWDLVIVEANDEIPVDLPSSMPVYGSEEWDALKNYVEGGGRAIMSFWDAGGDVYENMNVVNAFGISKTFSENITSTAGLTISPWNLSHPIFNGPSGSVGPITTFTDNGAIDGSRLDIVGVYTFALGGFAATPTLFQSAIVEANSGRTIYNGILFDRITGSSGQTLLANEISYLLVPEPAAGLLLAGGLLLLRGVLRRRAR